MGETDFESSVSTIPDTEGNSKAEEAREKGQWQGLRQKAGGGQRFFSDLVSQPERATSLPTSGLVRVRPPPHLHSKHEDTIPNFRWAPVQSVSRACTYNNAQEVDRVQYGTAESLRRAWATVDYSQKWTLILVGIASF